jgi:hypothetical protein
MKLPVMSQTLMATGHLPCFDGPPVGAPAGVFVTTNTSSTLLTTFSLLALTSLGLAAQRIWLAGSFALSPHLIFAVAALVGAVISYQRGLCRVPAESSWIRRYDGHDGLSLKS